ncbi:MAG: FHA domain-containing protein [Atopobiaceae bacterium]
MACAILGYASSLKLPCKNTDERPMPAMDLPSYTLYADLKAFGRISNRDAALVLLSPNFHSKELPLRSRAMNDRTFLSRDIVHAEPGKYQAEDFADFTRSTQTIETAILTHLGGGESSYQELHEHYAGPAAEAMRQSLAAAGEDGNLYANALSKIAYADQLSDNAKAQLCLMLFIICGCLGKPASAIAIVQDYARNVLELTIRTTETNIGPDFPKAASSTETDVRLGLMRIVNGDAQLPVEELSTDPAGTIIGALATGPRAITNVGFDVSRNHLRIWRENGTWWVKGLGSTNGTTLISGDSRKTYIVEPPRAEREPGKDYGPVELSMSDTLCLGTTTQFMVIRIAGSGQDTRKVHDAGNER